MKNVALIGLGRIGQMHGENLVSHKSFNLKYTFDVNDKINTKFLVRKYRERSKKKTNCYIIFKIKVMKNICKKYQFNSLIL